MELYTDSYIDGAFTGWDGTSVYRLVNGQVWQQTQYQWEFKHAYMPEAKVWKLASVFFLWVGGMTIMAEVRQIW